MSNIKQFFDKDGNDIFPVTHASAVFDSDGNNVIDQMSVINESINDISINVKSLGAKGDGVNDDTEYLSKALNEYDNVFIPNGIYLISESLHLKKYKQKMFGSSNSILKASDNFIGNDMIIMDGTVTPAYRSHQTLSDIIIQGNSTINGIKTIKNADFVIQNMVVDGFNYGLNVVDSLLFRVDDCTFKNNDTAIYFDGRTDLSPANNVMFYNCKIYANKCAIQQKSAVQCVSNVVFEGCEIEGNGIDETERPTVYIYANNDVGNNIIIRFTSCWIETNHNNITFHFESAQNYNVFVLDNSNVISSPKKQNSMILLNGEGIMCINNVSDNSSYLNHTLNSPDNFRVIAIGYFFSSISVNNKVNSYIYSTAKSRFESDVAINESKIRLRGAGGTGYSEIQNINNDLSCVATVGNFILNCAENCYWGNAKAIWNRPLRIGGAYIWTYDGILYQNKNKPTGAIDGDVILKLSTAVPESSTSEGIVGTIAADNDYIYICKKTNTWMRIKKDETW